MKSKIHRYITYCMILFLSINFFTWLPVFTSEKIIKEYMLTNGGKRIPTIPIKKSDNPSISHQSVNNETEVVNNSLVNNNNEEHEKYIKEKLRNFRLDYEKFNFSQIEESQIKEKNAPVISIKKSDNPFDFVPKGSRIFIPDEKNLKELKQIYRLSFDNNSLKRKIKNEYRSKDYLKLQKIDD